MNPPPKLPEGAVYLGIKRNLKIPTRSLGFIFREGKDLEWRDLTLVGSDYIHTVEASTHIAALADSELARLNAPEPVTGEAAKDLAVRLYNKFAKNGQIEGIDPAPPPAGAKGEVPSQYQNRGGEIWIHDPGNDLSHMWGDWREMPATETIAKLIRLEGEIAEAKRERSESARTWKWQRLNGNVGEDEKPFMLRVWNWEGEPCLVEVRRFEGTLYPAFMGCNIGYDDRIDAKMLMGAEWSPLPTPSSEQEPVREGKL